jgi:hypothetical protein
MKRYILASLFSAGLADLLRLVHIWIVRLRLAEDRLPHLPGGVEVFNSDADVIYFFDSIVPPLNGPSSLSIWPVSML